MPAPTPSTNVFDFSEYRAFVVAALEHERAERKGAQARLAAHMGCQSAYLSMVLKGRADLSLEQAAAAAEFFHLGDEARHYFLLLVQRERAGSESLRRYFDSLIAELKQARTVLARRLAGTSTLAPENQPKFYSSWFYTAIHIALTVPALQHRAALQKYLGLPPDVLSAALEFLVAAGLAVRDGERYVVGPTRLHLEQASAFASAVHAQVRLRTLSALALPKADDFHYSSTISAAPRDLPRLKEIMMRAIEEMRAVIRASPEEGVYCYAMDLFTLEA